MQHNNSSLKQLQDELKKQNLLIQRQHREKLKIKKQIENSVEEYYTLFVENNNQGKILENDGLGNSYNFVKDLLLETSKDIRLGLEILLKADEDMVPDLAELFFQIFYDSFTQVDAYHKKIVKTTIFFADYICDDLNQKIPKDQKLSISKHLSPKLKLILQQYIQQDSIKQYFSMLGNKVLNQIPTCLSTNSNKRWGSFLNTVQQFSFIEMNPKNSLSNENSNSFISVTTQIEAEQQLQIIVEEYLSDMQAKAELMPLTIKILINKLRKNLKISTQNKNKLIWELLFPEYLKPISPTQSFKQKSNSWNHMRSHNFRQVCDKIVQQITNKIKKSSINKIIEKVSYINEEYSGQKQIQNKIRVNGGCISYKQMYFIFKTIKANFDHLKPFNERVANRIKKIDDITPNFQLFLNFPNPTKSYVIFVQIIYGDLIEKDYYKLYNDTYKGQMIKNMMKQILSSSNFNALTFLQSGMNFKQILNKIIQITDQNGTNTTNNQTLASYTSEFIMKMKYLIYLMKKQHIDEQKIIRQLLIECLKREKQFITIFQKTKLHLLQSLTTVHKAKKLIFSKNESKNNIQRHLSLIKVLDNMQINLCITAASTRPENFKFIKSDSRNIIVEKGSQCCHQENIIQGLKSHSTSIIEAINIFCELKQVKQAINSGKDTAGIYQAFYKFQEFIKDNFRRNYFINTKEYNYFQKSIFKIILRILHEKLLESREKLPKDTSFDEKLKDLSFITPQKLKVQGLTNLHDMEQIWQISSRYFKNFLHVKKTPSEKIEIIKEAFEILKIAFRQYSVNKQQKIPNKSLQVMAAYVLIRCKPKKIVSNINFTEIFLSQQLLLKREGAILQRMKNSLNLIMNGRIKDYLIMDTDNYTKEFDETQIDNEIQNLKDQQKKISSMIYL